MEIQTNQIKKVCQLCGREFWVDHYSNRARYCSACRAKAMRRNQKRYRARKALEK